MRIKRFQGKAVNGYLDFDIKFFSKLTFITGINGSGKTTALNSIVSLLMPRIDFLATNAFEEISVTLNNGTEDIRIMAAKSENQTLLSSSNLHDQAFQIEEFIADPETPLHREAEYENDFYRELLSRNSQNSVLKYILGLPTPMYLNLDRRLVTRDNLPLRAPPVHMRRYSRPPIKRNVFGRSLGQSLQEAIQFAEGAYRENAIRKNRLDEQFRRDILTALLDFPPIAFSNTLEAPTAAERKGLQKAKENLARLPDLLRVPAESISSKLDPLFSFLDDRAAKLKDMPKRQAETLESDGQNFDALVDWSFNKTHLKKINIISDMITSNNVEAEKINKRIDMFLSSINSFFCESGKAISFDEHGQLYFRLKNENSDRELRTLSSGEVQLFVILTHLHFNPEAKEAGVFIIDEPELSLHVQWQEKFVEGLQEAAPNIQLILASHSPSIILDKTKSCRDISQ